VKLVEIRLAGFQSFGSKPTTLTFEDLTFLLGPNGAGKTAALQALARLFGFEPSTRRIRPADFHVPATETEPPAGRELWIEARFEFPEVRHSDEPRTTVPGHWRHMQLEDPEGIPEVRIRLTASIDIDAEIEESIAYVLRADEEGEPVDTAAMHRQERSQIHVHYLPARRDPSEQVSYAARSMLGRALRAASWTSEKETIQTHTDAISETLKTNDAVHGISQELESHWTKTHRGTHFAEPSLTFDRNDVDGLLRHLNIAFSPGHGLADVDLTHLSDGQQSLLYLSLVLSMQSIGRKVLDGEAEAFDIDKLRPAVFTLIAMEEPENSLSPHSLGRVVRQLEEFAGSEDTQAVVATHAPPMLRRVPPEHIRYLRLAIDRTTTVSKITLPPDASEASKYVREAIQSFPELYFSRFVVLGEGASEEIILPRLLDAHGVGGDQLSVSVVPLGGRHVNHFWRLLNDLGIPHATLLDLDLGRHRGGWGRIKYAANQLLKCSSVKNDLEEAHIDELPKWNSDTNPVASQSGTDWIDLLETVNVFFSSPIDIDFAMMSSYPDAYGVDSAELIAPDHDTTTAVLGKSHAETTLFSDDELNRFDAYRGRFKRNSKPAGHLGALSQLTDQDLKQDMPDSLARMAVSVAASLAGLPE